MVTSRDNLDIFKGKLVQRDSNVPIIGIKIKKYAQNPKKSPKIGIFSRCTGPQLHHSTMTNNMLAGKLYALKSNSFAKQQVVKDCPRRRCSRYIVVTEISVPTDPKSGSILWIGQMTSLPWRYYLSLPRQLRQTPTTQEYPILVG